MSLRQTSPTRRLSRSKPSQWNPSFSTNVPDGVLSGMDEGLHAAQAELVEAEVEHRRDRLGSKALPMARGNDDIADGHALNCGCGRHDS